MFKQNQTWALTQIEIITKVLENTNALPLQSSKSVQIFIRTCPIIYIFEFNVTQTRIMNFFAGINQ